jgi:hypothetical protein
LAGRVELAAWRSYGGLGKLEKADYESTAAVKKWRALRKDLS